MTEVQRCPYWGQANINRLPKGIIGMVAAYAAYKQDAEFAVTKLQKYLNLDATGIVDENTCKKLEDMIECNGVMEVLNPLGDYLKEGEMNGAVYRLGQYQYKPNGITDPRQHAQITISFSKDHYGEIIENDRINRE